MYEKAKKEYDKEYKYGFEKAYKKSLEDYPEWEFPPEKLYSGHRYEYIKRFLEPVNLEIKGVKLKYEKFP